MGSDGCTVPNGRPESGGGRRPGGLFAVVDIGSASAVGVSARNWRLENHQRLRPGLAWPFPAVGNGGPFRGRGLGGS